MTNEILHWLCVYENVSSDLSDGNIGTFPGYKHEQHLIENYHVFVLV